MGEKVKAKRTLFSIPVLSITTSHNCRYPLSDEFAKAGWGTWEPGEAGSLVELARGSDADRVEYVRLVDEYDPALKALAASLLTVGQINPIDVRDNGTKKGANTYSLVAGARRTLATLYNWCAGATKIKEPVIDAVLVGGNSVDALYVSIAENSHRKGQTAIEDAQAYQRAINTGATIDQVAESVGVSAATVRGRLELLKLEPKQQQAVAEGRVGVVAAIATARGKPVASAADTPRLRTRLAIIRRLRSTPNRDEANALRWVLQTDKYPLTDDEA